MRKYAKQLLDQIHAKEHVETVDGVPVLMKPVPDDRTGRMSGSAAAGSDPMNRENVCPAGTEGLPAFTGALSSG